jgi:hypothetical protein
MNAVINIRVPGPVSCSGRTLLHGVSKLSEAECGRREGNVFSLRLRHNHKFLLIRVQSVTNTKFLGVVTIEHSVGCEIISAATRDNFLVFVQSKPFVFVNIVVFKLLCTLSSHYAQSKQCSGNLVEDLVSESRRSHPRGQKMLASENGTCSENESFRQRALPRKSSILL